MLNDNSWQRVPNPIFHEVLLYYLLSHRFRNFAQCLTHPRYFRCFLLWLNLWTQIFWTLALWYQQHLAVCFMQQGVKFTKGLTGMTWFLLVLWFEITHANAQDTIGPIYWCTLINIYWLHLLYAHSTYLYCSYWYKNLLYRGPQCLCLSKITHF